MSGNRIYQGPMERQPETVSDKTVAAALLPGTFVAEGVSTFAQATTPAGSLLRLLANRDFYSINQLDATDPLLTAYVSGETGVAYKIEPGQRYQAACAAATYTWGQELTVAAAGRVAGAASTNVVVAYSREAGAKSAGTMLDIEIANFYTKA